MADSNKPRVWNVLLGASFLAGLAAAPADARARYDVTVVRTTYGIPHITAADHAGLGYGVGYTAAEDNFCIIADQLLTVRGERSRYFGQDEKSTVGFQQISNLESDLYHKIVGDIGEIRKGAARASREYTDLIGGFAAGFNRYLKDKGGQLPAPCGGTDWVQPMSSDDALLLFNAAMMEASSNPFARQIANAAPPAAASANAAATALPPPRDPSAIGSNGWAFGSQATANGRGLVVGNPHFPWQGANRFRQMHLTIPGKLDVMGAGLVITPFVAIGFNKDVAWTHTVSTAQHLTLFELAIDPKDPTAYLVDGRSEPMKRRTISVDVKGGQPVTRMAYFSRYGPVAISPQGGLTWTTQRAFSLRDANLFNQRAGDTWLTLSKARNVREIRGAIGRSLGIPYVNTIAADRGGEALYADVTAVPNVSAEKVARCSTDIGKAPALVAQRLFVLDGSRSACAWDADPSTPIAGLMPERLMPTLFRRDYVQNSNDSYWLSNPAAPLPAASPLIGLTGTRPGFRTQSGIIEIGRRLSGTDGLPGRKVDQESAKAMAFANRSLAAERMLDDLLTLCGGQEALAAACSALSGWDRRADVGSKGALLFFGFLRNAGQIKDMYAIPFDPADPVNTPRGLSKESGTADAVRKALAAAAAELTRLGIPLDAPLGSVQVAQRGSQRIPIHGGPGQAGILNAMTSRPAGDALVPVHGTSCIQVVSFDDRGPVADAILSYSQSTDPASPHIADQTRAYSAKKWHRLPFSKDEIARDAATKPLRLSE